MEAGIKATQVLPNFLESENKYDNELAYNLTYLI